MFIYIKEKNTIINVDQLCSIRLESHSGKAGEENDVSLIFQMLRDIHVIENIKISLTKSIEFLLPKDIKKETLIEFSGFLLSELMSYIGYRNITLDNDLIQMIYKSFVYKQYNTQRIKELSNLDSHEGIGKDMADCFIDREQDYQNEDPVSHNDNLTKDSINTMHSLNMLNEEAAEEFFKNETFFRQEFNIPVDPNDKESIKAFNNERREVLGSDFVPKEEDEDILPADGQPPISPIEDIAKDVDGQMNPKSLNPENC